MPKKKRIHVGTIKSSDLKVRKKPAPPAQPHKSPKDYDRQRIRQQDRSDIEPDSAG